MYRQLSSIKMIPYSILDEEEQRKVSHRVLPVKFTITVSKQNPFNRKNFTPFFLLEIFLLLQQDHI